MHVHQPFELHLPDHAVEAGERKAGEGCYVSTTIHNRRYYGVLIDQAALTAASMLHFQNEAAGLELNRKIELLKQQKLDQEQSVADRKRHADSDASLESDRKRIHLAECAAKIPGDKQTSEEVVTRPGICGRPVQKFRYVNPVPANEKAPASPGYRILLATYADATVAADDDPEKAKLIEAACRVGGGYVGTQHYFQYEVSYITKDLNFTFSESYFRALTLLHSKNVKIFNLSIPKARRVLPMDYVCLSAFTRSLNSSRYLTGFRLQTCRLGNRKYLVCSI